MDALDLVTTEALLDEIIRRQDAKEVVYLFALGSDDGENFIIDHNMDEEQLVDVWELVTGSDDWEWEDE